MDLHALFKHRHIVLCERCVCMTVVLLHMQAVQYLSKVKFLRSPL
jgi:hypothetical protein